MSEDNVKIRLLFVDEGSYQHEEIEVARTNLEGYDRLIDFLREEPAVLRTVYLDLERLCSAHLVSG